jgi:3D (Asp-Asp-Asp) domain-containing protein
VRLAPFRDAPEPQLTRIRAKVTACAPDDAIDIDYYRKNGYEGGDYGIAAHTEKFPRGTLVRVPGYRDVTAPGAFWVVDSAGGSLIRRSARRGVVHIDVKFKHTASAKKWGVKTLDIDVITPAAQAEWRRAYVAWAAERDAYYGTPQ